MRPLGKSANVISISASTEYYDRLPAINRISFEIKEAELFGFSGYDGLREATTGRVLTGLSHSNTGTVEAFHYDTSNGITELI